MTENKIKLLKLSSLATDIKAESKGELVPVIRWTGLDPDAPFAVTDLPGVKFFVRSDNYDPYKVARQKLAEDILEKSKASPDARNWDEYSEVEHGRLMVEHLLLGWEGLDEAYAPEIAMTALTNPESRTLRQMVIFCARKVGRRKAEFVETAAKN
jgi:hypothetical protein